MELFADWEYVADTVMGGVSRGRAERKTVAGRTAMHLTGMVSLENNGGFVQMAFDLAGGATFDASGFSGLSFDVLGNGARYDVRVRTDALTRPWQSFRAEFEAPTHWTTLNVAFGDLVPHRTKAIFDPARVRRIGILAVGREMQADIAVSSIRLYRDHWFF